MKYEEVHSTKKENVKDDLKEVRNGKKEQEWN